jgi:hypothetical protein
MIYLLFQMQRVCRYASGPVKNYGSTSNYSPSYQTTRQNTNGYRYPATAATVGALYRPNPVAPYRESPWFHFNP